MGKRSKARSDPKRRPRKKPAPKRRAAPKVKARSRPPAAADETPIARLSRELNDARDQLAAMSEVLHAISRSKFELSSVLESVAEAAARLCRADGAVIFQLDGDVYRFAAGYSLAPAYREIERQSIIAPGPGTVVGRAAISRRVIRIDDLLSDPHYELKEESKAEGYRSMIGVPLMRDGEAAVVIGMGRRRIDPFGDREIELATTFAAQAMIAIENARLLNELRQSLEQQTANSEVLQAISRTPGDLAPVFATMLEKATRICQAEFAALYRLEGDGLRLDATYNVPPTFAEAEGMVFRPAPGGALDEVLNTGRTAHVSDLAATRSYIERHPRAVEAVEIAGIRTTLGVPMVKDNDLIGIIGLFRQQVRPFNDKQIELVTDFAAQAVIAIENARLLNELRQRTTDLTERTADLTEALEQQTATSEVLQVISSSPGDLRPVFATMLEKAVRICDATFGNIFRWQDDVLHLVATHNTPPAFAEFRRRSPLRSSPQYAVGRTVATKAAVHVADLAAERPYIEERDPGYVAAVELGGVRTFLAVPMLKESELIGLFTVYRQEVRPFSDKQVALVTNFAAQAVIAIENARLLNELRQRTTDLSEALEQQTATSEVLKVISGSPSDLRPVFEAMLDNATRICQASLGTMTLYENGGFRHVALHGAPAAYEELRAREPVIVPKAAQGLGRLASTKQVVHIADSLSEPPEARGGLTQLAAARTLLIVPMLKEQELVGSFGIYRQEVRPFTDKQIALVQNFAAQAVIAIENARLLNELRQRTTDLSEALEQQTATSEVLQVISSSPGELDPVFAAMLASATHICEAKFGNLFLREGETFRAVAWHGEATYVENWRQEPLTIKTDVPDIPLARLAATKQRVYIADLRQDVAYKAGFAPLVTLVDKGGARTLLIVPMLKERTLVGAIAIYRQEVRPFSEKQVQLLENFAAQAVIAIENARLLGELRERTEEVVKLNERLEQRVTDQVGEIERMGRLRRFLPPQVADLIVASGSEKQLESHRREITALFCDLRGFTGFSESSDPEDVMALLRDYHAAIGEIIIKYSGTLERYAGDGVMVVFNDPVPVDNPALQAVLMALEMRDAIGAMTDKWRRMGHDIGFGIGIAHGFATLGTIGFEGRFDYAAIGTVSNVASRLCDEAKPGQILISPRVLMEIEDAIAVEPVGEFTLKGIRRPLAAYNVLAARAGQQPQADSGVS